jgi:hypothetical protein
MMRNAKSGNSRLDLYQSCHEASLIPRDENPHASERTTTRLRSWLRYRNRCGGEARPRAEARPVESREFRES